MFKANNSLVSRGIRKLRGLSDKYSIPGNLTPKRDIRNKLKKISPFLTGEGATLPFSEYNILSHPKVKEADIIHLHWVAGILDYATFFKKNTKAVIWTLHDMNPFQGLFHYKEEELRNIKIASELNDTILEIKKSAIQKRKCSLSIVCPSKWILEEAVSSTVFNNVRALKIAYPLNTEIFTTHINDDLKSKLKIKEKSIIFLFVSETVENHRKGFAILIEALKQLSNLNITLLVIGYSNNIDIPGLNIISLGNIADKCILANYYSLADAFIIPSREDNLPNVMLESLACGTPVLGFNVGGMAEIIEDNFNGLKAYEINVEALKKIIENFIISKDKFDRKAIRQFALDNFSNHIIASEYIDLYNEASQRNLHT